MPAAKHFSVKLDSTLHRALRRRIATTGQSISSFVSDAVRIAITQDDDDLAAINDRCAEPRRSFESFLASLWRAVEAAEDRIDLADLRRAKRAADAAGEKPMPYETVRKRLGLGRRAAASVRSASPRRSDA